MQVIEMQKNSISTIIRNAVLTKNQSKIYVKRVVSNVLENIFHQRINFDRSEFRKLKFNDLHYNVFKQKLKDESLKWLRSSIKEAMNAFDKDCLRELFVLFVSPKNENSVIEFYRISFKNYDRKIIIENEKVTKLGMDTYQILESITDMSDSMFDPNEVDVKFLMRFKDDNVLGNLSFKNYKPDDDSRGINLLENVGGAKDQLGAVDTGFHTVKIRFNNEMATNESKDDMEGIIDVAVE